MKFYSFDVTLLATIDVEAASREEAERIIRGVCEGGKVTVHELATGATEPEPDADSVSGTCDIEGEMLCTRRV